MKRLFDFAQTVVTGVAARVVVGVVAAGGFSYGGLEVRWVAEEIVEELPPPDRPAWVAPVQTIGFVDEPWEKVYPGDPAYPIEIPEPELEPDIVEPENGWYEDALPAGAKLRGIPVQIAKNDDDDDDGKWIKRPPK